MDKRKRNLETARSTYENKYYYKCVVRLTEEEYEMIDKKRAGHSIAEYLKIAGMKRRITKHRVSNLSSAFLSELSTELGRIGNNLNQVARLANIERINKSSDTSKIEQEIESIAPQLHKTFSKVLDYLSVSSTK